MELTTELKNIKNNSSSVKSVLEHLKQEQIQLDKKVYIFKVLDLAKELTDMVDSGLTSANKIHGLVVHHYVNFVTDDKCIVHFLDSKGKVMDIKNGKTARFNFTQKITSLFNGLGLEVLDYVSEDFQSSRECFVPLKKGVDEKILELFLNKELTSMLNCSKMQVDLEDSLHVDSQTPSNIKRRKI